MCSRSRKKSLLILALSVSAASCGRPSPFSFTDRSPKSDRQAPFDPPNQYPSWAYDQTSYVKPAEELTPEPRVRPGDPLHYFTKDKVIMIRQPAGYTPEEIPRVAVWWTDNNGFHWHKAGYFGRQQSFFPLEAAEDGDYGVRFVGPGQAAADHALAVPERVYHVDTACPEVSVTIEPEQAQYHVAQTITISWRAQDRHLLEAPVSIGMLYDESAKDSRMIEVQRSLADEGSINFVIPPEALDQQIRFRVDARDRADNVGIIYSQSLQVVPEQAQLIDELADRRVGEFDDIQASGAEGDEVLPYPTMMAREARAAGGLAWGGDSDTILPTGQASDISRGPRRAAGKPVERRAATNRSRPSGRPAKVAWGNDDEWDELEPAKSAKELTAEPGDAAERDGDQPSAMRSKKRASDDRTLTDVTYGNKLLVPLPATLTQEQFAMRTLLAHPWRSLGRGWEAAMPTVWTLAKPRFSYELSRLFEGGILARGALRTAGSRPHTEEEAALAGHSERGPPESRGEPSP